MTFGLRKANMLANCSRNSFQDFQPDPVHQRLRQTDRRHAIARPRFAL